MIRRDYILRMIEEFIQALARINALKTGQRWQEAAGAVDDEFQRLIGAGAQTVARLTETELLARLIRGEPTQAVRDKTLMLTALLNDTDPGIRREALHSVQPVRADSSVRTVLNRLAQEDESKDIRSQARTELALVPQID